MTLMGKATQSHSILPTVAYSRKPVISKPVPIMKPSLYFHGLFHIFSFVYSVGWGSKVIFVILLL